MDKVDIVVIGAGVIGLAVARELSLAGREIMVIEKNASYGMETSSRNSEVIHSGIYYPASSLKSRLCIEGNALLYELCLKYKIPHRNEGKLLVARNKDEIGALHALHRNARECGVPGVEFLPANQISDMEPSVKAEASLFCPTTGIVDTHSLMRFLHMDAVRSGADFVFSVEVTGINKNNDDLEVIVKEPDGGTFVVRSGMVINCAGLNSDIVAQQAGIDVDKERYRIHFCKGQYFRLANPDKFRVKHPVYPPPAKHGLGIHLTPDLGGGLRVGPDAVYVTQVDYGVDMSAKNAFYSDLRLMLPSLKEDDLIADTAGIRPKLHGPGASFADFIIREESDKGLRGMVNCIGIESPGLTSCLAVARMIKCCLK